MRALVLTLPGRRARPPAPDEYLFGPDLLVAPITDENTRRPVYLPAGDWTDYWTGAPATGPRTLLVDAPADVIPVWVRTGAVLPKIPEDIMTLVPEKESGNSKVKSLDNRRIYEVVGSAGQSQIAGKVKLTDFEGRSITRDGNTLSITGDTPAHVIVRFRFARPTAATVNGTATQLRQTPDGPTVEFDFTKAATITWQ